MPTSLGGPVALSPTTPALSPSHWPASRAAQAPGGNPADAAHRGDAPAPADATGSAAEAARKDKVGRGEAAEKPNGEALSEAELRQLEQLKTTDQEVRRHELAHQIAGGPYTGGASYEYERGPDGQRYAVAGEVPIDYGPVAGDPRATIDKMQQVISAALAPADPSPKDHQVAATARQYLLTAQLELAQQQSEMNSARQPEPARAEAASNDRRDTPSLSRYDIVTRTAQASGNDSLKG